MNEVKFKVGTYEEYKALSNPDESCIYFLLDTKQLFKGSILMGTGNIEGLSQSEKIELYGGSATEVIE